METLDISQTQEILTVSKLNREVRFILEGSFDAVWVEGEISNFMVPASGHWYFSLKDASAQVRCAIFKPNNRRLGFTPKDGMHVIMKARVSLYEGRGEFQLLGEHLEEVGEGQLRKAFEALKNRLHAAGLFEGKHKKSLPHLPTCIGVVTSPTGAAVRDILSVLRRRFPCVPVIIYPTMVQGDTAAPAIVKALALANERKECDVLIVARGGGSLEDLWPFNEEMVAHAIFNSVIPIISGVGHEVDFTIADFVADVRAPTPSAAAELITPDRDELMQTLDYSHQRMLRLMQQKILQLQQHIDFTVKQLSQQHPKRRLQQQFQQVELALAALLRLQMQQITRQQSNVKTLSAELASLTPMHRVASLQQNLTLQLQKLQNSMNRKVQTYRERLGNAAATLDALSPLATLQRGYAVARKDKHVLVDSSQVRVGDNIDVRLLKGSLHCQVLKTENT